MEFEKIISVMEEEAMKRNAPVFALKEKTSEPFKILVSAILSTRTRDEQTVMVSERLFRKVSSFSDIKKLSIEELEELLRGVGFYRNKARILKDLAERLDGKDIPDTMDKLLELPGVGRKVANIVLSEAFGKPAIAVDTHVHRISNRLGIVKTRNPEETEKELKKIVPEKLWRRLNKAFVGYGQTVCRPIKPLCHECRISELCKYYDENFRKNKIYI